MKYIGENALKKLISLIKGDLATKQPTITASGLLKGDGAGTVTAADTQEATLVDVPNGLLKGDGTTISAAVAEMDYMVPPIGGITGQVLKKTETGTEWADASFKPEGNSYLTFSSPNSFTLAVNDATKHWDGTLEYFSSNRTWTVWDGTATLSSVDNDGEYVLYLRGTGNSVITGDNQNYRWILTGSNIACIGNIENLLDYATVESGAHPTMAAYCYGYMFRGCTALTQAPALPATTLASYCYNYMFSSCTALTQAPALPVTTLAIYCYADMFSGCTALTQAPALPATTLVSYCYAGMFSGCTALTQAPALPATTLASYCYNYMFYGCTALTQAPALPATTLAPGCYADMFLGCTSLIQAPALPATTLVNYCYADMFQGCTALTQAPALPATTLASYCYNYMFKDCTALTQAPALPATALVQSCYKTMFQGCTALTQAPALPATTLADYCYQSMFQGCTSLKLSSTQTGEYTQEYRIPASGTGTSTTDALTDMFTNTGGTFTGTPEINTTYYLSTDNMIVRETEISTLNGYVGSMIMASAIPINEKGAANGVASLGADGKVPSAQLPSLDYIPTVQKGEANGVASLGSDGKVPSTQLPSLDYVPTSQKGTAGGVASLGEDGKVPSAQLPEMGAQTYTATLLSTGWAADGSYQKQTVTVTGLKASYPVSPVVDAQLSGTDADGDAAILTAFAEVNILQTAANQLIAYIIGSAPETNIPLIINTWG